MAQRTRWRRERVQVYNAPAKSTTRSLTALLPTLANLKQLSLARCKPAFKHPDDLRRVLLAAQVRRTARRPSDGTRFAVEPLQEPQHPNHFGFSWAVGTYSSRVLRVFSRPG